jgi:membrane-bound lytic murein transglycosylase D
MNKKTLTYSLSKWLCLVAASHIFTAFSMAQSATNTNSSPANKNISIEPKVVELLENSSSLQANPATSSSSPAQANTTQSTTPVAQPDFPVPAELIAKPINESDIGKYTSTATVSNGSLWNRIRNGFAMPNLDTQLASEKTTWYAKQPDYMGRMTERGSQYLFYIVEELEKRGMPTEIALLPFVESAFNPQAVSSAKAAGMWQFMPATGKHFNLKQNVWRDERRGVVESTRAALDYLQKLHGMFGDWHLALAAYNWGEGSVQRAINKNRAKGLSTEYTALSMPNETAHYVPKFQAIKNIVQSPEAYGIKLAPLDNAPFFASVIKERDIDVSLAAKFAGMSLNEFKALNPGFKKPVILGANKPEILLPASKLGIFNDALMNHRGSLSSWTTMTVAGTEKPSAVAQRYGMTEQALRDVNNIPPRMLIKPGSTLVVPKRNPEQQTENISAKMEQAQLNLAPELIRRGLVTRKGDTWAKIAKRSGVSAASLRDWNRTVGAELKTGTRISYYTAGSVGKKTKASNREASKSKRGGATKSSNKPQAKKRR